MAKSAAAGAESSVTTASDDVLPSAKDVMRQVAEIEAKKAADRGRKLPIGYRPDHVVHARNDISCWLESG